MRHPTMEAIDKAGADTVNRNDSDVADGVGSGLDITNENASHVQYFSGPSASDLTSALLLGR